MGYSIPNYTKEQLAELDAKNIEYNGKMYSEYEISQIQRAKERNVRTLKRQCVASQTALENAPDDVTKSEMQADYSKNAVKLKSAEKQLREFCKQTGRRNDTFRTQVNGFGRSEAQKAVWANKKAQNFSSQSDSDLLSEVKNILTGKGYINFVNEFEKSLSSLRNKKVASILKKACEDVTFKKSKRKKNYFKKKENAVYLVKNPKLSTIAHELFHKVDHDNEITRNRLLEDCINSDYENLRKIAEKAGLSLEDMLYLKYPEAFEEKGRMKEEYRGFSDIIHGMTLQKVNLGYGHYEDGYWEKPLKLEKETFAQYGRIYYKNNPNVMKLVSEMLPKTSERMAVIINMII